MLERATAFLAQTAAAFLAVAVMIGILGYSHSAFYRQGYCAAVYDPYDPYCSDQGMFADMWPFAGDPNNAPGQVPGQAPYQTPGQRPGLVPGQAQGQPARPPGSQPTTIPRAPGAAPPANTNAAPSGGGFSQPSRPTVRVGPPPAANPAPQGSSGLPVSDSFPGVAGGRPLPGFRPGVRPPAPTPLGPAGRRICDPLIYSPEADQSNRDRDNRDPALEELLPVTDQVSVGDEARCWLEVGDAYFAVDNVEEAQVHWDTALRIGADAGGSQASLMAHQRLQAAVLERSCPTSLASLARIARGYDSTQESGEVIDLWVRQQALKSLGFYPGEVDGSYGPMTRRAVSDFQNEMGFDRTGALTPRETVTLICHAALTARDPIAQNHLGVMFATGLGVRQNIDTALEWLNRAANRDHDGANYNLAVIYGTGTIQGSYRLCGVVESPQRADSYLRRAAELGHPYAQRLRADAALGGPASRRWERIEQRLIDRAVNQNDRFYLAWLARVDEARRGFEINDPRSERQRDIERVFQAGCFYEPIEQLDDEAVQAILTRIDPADDYVDRAGDYVNRRPVDGRN